MPSKIVKDLFQQENLSKILVLRKFHPSPTASISADSNFILNPNRLFFFFVCDKKGLSLKIKMKKIHKHTKTTPTKKGTPTTERTPTIQNHVKMMVTKDNPITF